MRDPSIRYSDSELITSLQMLAYNSNKRPSQRLVLNSPYTPTHHTIIKRFGSMGEALKLSGLDDMEDSSGLHEAIRITLESKGYEILMEYGDLGNGLIVDFIAIKDGNKFYFDFMLLMGVNDEVKGSVARMRSALALSITDGDYIQMLSINDIMVKIK